MKAQTSGSPGRTRRAILDILKQEGAVGSQELASRLDLSAMAVRQHLYDLQKTFLVHYQESPRPLGRPEKIWSLTPAADQFFPDEHAQLTLDLIHGARRLFGENGINQLAEFRGRQQVEVYRKRVPHGATLHRKLAILAEIRTEEGYMAKTQPQKDGSVLLIENHCPICSAAKICTGLCKSELEVFQKVLGKNVRIERTEHIMAGARRCVYRAV
jgi:predicted ArsR family transcriptional regulator